jgi:hypothetical protein
MQVGLGNSLDNFDIRGYGPGWVGLDTPFIGSDNGPIIAIWLGFIHGYPG